MTQLTSADLIDTLAGIAPGSPLDLLRRERVLIREYAQSCCDVIFRLAPGQGISGVERHAIALRIAHVSAAAGLAAHHRQVLESESIASDWIVAVETGDGAGLDERTTALLRHAELLSLSPALACPAHLHVLSGVGLSLADIVVVSQVIGFVNYQTRLLAGLNLLAGHDIPKARPGQLPSLPADIGANFTLDELDWHAWLPPVSMGATSAEQREVIKEAWPGADKSEFFRLLVREPEILRHRMKLLNSIMYAPRGLPRAERELAATMESRLNGCPYCASVHGRLYTQLAKEDTSITAILEHGAQARLEGRKSAVADYTANLTPTPPAVNAQNLSALRGHGLSDMEILDLTQAVAIFAWANRLMQTLGEPLSETSPAVERNGQES